MKACDRYNLFLYILYKYKLLTMSARHAMILTQQARELADEKIGLQAPLSS